MTESLPTSPSCSRASARGSALLGSVVRKGNKMSKVRFSPANPGPVANSFAAYVSGNHGIEISAEQAQALFSYHREWQTWRNAPGGEAEQEKVARDAKNAADVAVSKAAQIEKAKKLLAEAGIETVEPAVAAKKGA